jgi:fibronectin-binding autotransporter adhesin
MLFAGSPAAQLAQLGVSDTPPAPGAGPWSAWFTGDYASAGFSGNASNFGFGYQSGGGEGGIDYRAPDFVAGGAFAYDHADVTQNTTGDNGTIGSWRLGAYASWQPGPWSFTGALAGGFHDISASRLTVLPMPASSSYGARSFDAAVEAADRIALWGGTLQPMVGLVYTDLHLDGFSESGGVFDITGRAADTDALRGYAGGRAYQTFDLANGMALTPEVRARVLYDFLDDARALTATFAADPTQTSFLVSGLQPARLGGLFGAGASLQLAPQWRGFVSYDAEVRGGDVAHLVTAGLKVDW